ncbi:MAG TPA: DUF4231 domain-containing protein [Syntrophobacteraceae bacterium]|jgi:hypothetical protein|nr:DUF4231 domain-containing protein [Syntrophobacteraceae bacterium]
MPALETTAEPTELFGSWKPSDYIEQRAKQYQAWYDKKAVTTKAVYLRMRTATVLGGVVVPVIVNTALPGKDVIASIISLVVAACVALESVYHYREQWKNYRSTEQFLSREQALFLTGEGGYKEFKSPRAAFIYFVERCEGAIEAENASTLNVMTLAQQEAKSTKAVHGGANG